MKFGKALGMDGIAAKFLKNVGDGWLVSQAIWHVWPKAWGLVVCMFIALV